MKELIQIQVEIVFVRYLVHRRTGIMDKFNKIMKSDEAYVAQYDERTKEIQMRAKKLVYRFNNTEPDMEVERKNILKDLFCDSELSACIEPPFHCDYGFNVKFQGFTLINYNCSILDTSPVYIGENTFIAPGVCISCAGHAIHPQDRKSVDTSKPIYIGNDVWIGANATVLGGVHIGSGSIIGAGSVVTSDIPENVIAVGVPCKVLRSITENDRLHMQDTIETI